MARKAIVDKDIILDLLKKGETTQRIAERFKVSRQAIDLHRKGFINNGLLPDKRAVRTSGERGPSVTPQQEIHRERSDVEPSGISPAKIPEKENMESLDTQIDLIISAFNALKRLPAVEKELEALKQENKKARQEIERLTARENRRLEQENRWMSINTELPDE